MVLEASRTNFYGIGLGLETYGLALASKVQGLALALALALRAALTIVGIALELTARQLLPK